MDKESNPTIQERTNELQIKATVLFQMEGRSKILSICITRICK